MFGKATRTSKSNDNAPKLQGGREPARCVCAAVNKRLDHHHPAKHEHTLVDVPSLAYWLMPSLPAKSTRIRRLPTLMRSVQCQSAWQHNKQQT